MFSAHRSAACTLALALVAGTAHAQLEPEWIQTVPVARP